MFKCKYCNREFEKSTALAGHISHCKENPNKKRTEETWQNAGKKVSHTLNERHKQYKQLHPEKYITTVQNVCLARMLFQYNGL